MKAVGMMVDLVCMKDHRGWQFEWSRDGQSIV